MKKESLILIGGGGHCKSCIDVIEQENALAIYGILDSPDKRGQSVLKYPVIGTDDDIEHFAKKGFSFLITVGQIRTATVRRNLFIKLEQASAKMATVISPKAYVSKHAHIGAGTIVMHGATVNAGAKINENCIINTGCNIEHDVEIGAHCHISTHAVVNGDCIIYQQVFIGSNAVLSNGISVVGEVSIGSGAVVIRPIEEKGVYVGNPAKKISN